MDFCQLDSVQILPTQPDNRFSLSRENVMITSDKPNGEAVLKKVDI